MKKIFPIIAIMLGMAIPAQASLPDCETIAAQVGQQAGLPPLILPAIARIESGRKIDGERRAWPWALNHAGKSLYFETQASALSYLKTATVNGRTNIDVGCMQINHYWHSEEFQSLDLMMDPKTNVTYAVKFLKELYAKHGSWAEAVKHYHSPDEERGMRYLTGFDVAFNNMKSTGLISNTSLLRMPPTTNFFSFGTSDKQSVEMGLGLMMSSTEKAANADANNASYLHLIASLGSEVNNDEIRIFPVFNELAEPSQVRGVLNAKWSQVQAMRKVLSRN
ncbi:lytic transglycosylase domain-containing protein [uncultured Planktomarina sp.]|jgi:hypothetical protein|uniref:lytic transglycosylase domain-containing protein n=1 Tax=uncultured Planktomarina sp. TaxID=1538529 RepID=UPI0032611D10